MRKPKDLSLKAACTWSVLCLMFAAIVSLPGCNEAEKIRAANIARTAMFVALGTGSPATGTTPVSYDADALFLPTAEALVRLAFAKDPAAKAKVREIAAFVIGGIDDSTFVSLDDVQWAVLESIPEGSNPLWAGLVVALRMELSQLAESRGVSADRINVNVRQLLGMVIRISNEQQTVR